MIMFTYNELYGGNKTIIYDKQIDKQVVLFPGIQIWSIITKPYSRFLVDVIENIKYIINKKSFE